VESMVSMQFDVRCRDPQSSPPAVQQAGVRMVSRWLCHVRSQNMQPAIMWTYVAY